MKFRQFWVVGKGHARDPSNVPIVPNVPLSDGRYPTEMHTCFIHCFVVDDWREYTSYEVDLKEEKITEIDLNVMSTGKMDVLCAEGMAAYSKG